MIDIEDIEDRQTDRQTCSSKNITFFLLPLMEILIIIMQGLC